MNDSRPSMKTMPRIATAWSNRRSGGRRTHEAGCRDDPPDHRWRAKEREGGEADDAQDAADDVEPVRLERLEQDELAAEALGQHRHDAGHRQEQDRQRQPRRQAGRRPNSPKKIRSLPERSIWTGKMRTKPIRKARAIGLYGNRFVPRLRPQEADADPEEAAEQHEVREEREVDDVRAGPPDERQLDEQDEEGEEDEPERPSRRGRERCLTAVGLCITVDVTGDPPARIVASRSQKMNGPKIGSARMASKSISARSWVPYSPAPKNGSALRKRKALPPRVVQERRVPAPPAQDDPVVGLAVLAHEAGDPHRARPLRRASRR